MKKKREIGDLITAAQCELVEIMAVPWEVKWSPEKETFIKRVREGEPPEYAEDVRKAAWELYQEINRNKWDAEDVFGEPTLYQTAQILDALHRYKGRIPEHCLEKMRAILKEAG